MPFSPFTGVNHHLQSVQFGCALLLDETEDSFVWAFETFLGAVGGQPPTSIITDQDKAMGLAIRRVFPKAMHRYFLWHILKKFPSYLPHVYVKKSSFKKEIKWCIRGTYRIADFETLWKNLMVKYNLVGHEWLSSLYDIKERWVPVYHLDTFYAGMNTTGRSEGMNSFYKDFFTYRTSLREFIYKNEKCLERIASRERSADYEIEHKNHLVKDTCFLINSASHLYTRNVYTVFKRQWDKATSNFKLLDSKTIGDKTIYTYKSRKVYENKEWVDNREWIMEFNIRTLKGKCEFKYFEFMGIPCGHLIKVFKSLDIVEISESFGLKRWMRGANLYKAKYDGGLACGHQSSMVLRIAHITKVSTQLSYEAAEDNESYTWMLTQLDDL